MAGLDVRIVKYKKRSKKAVLVEILRFNRLGDAKRAQIPQLNKDIENDFEDYKRLYGGTQFGERKPNDFSALHNAAQVSRVFWIAAKRTRQSIIQQYNRNMDLRNKMGEWLKDKEAAKTKYGHISGWDVSRVTNMDLLFLDTFGDKMFTDDISSWDVSNVTNMRDMFSCSVFNSDISSWNVGKVTCMEGIFWRAESFNCDLS
ncbi:hypothetical protein TrLO_g15208 [Triparma laevis f. longispina]|uniref:BspA family leucine-rich repeat surface protein n=1 Tax=Triparma laevis f. longispina TaxID=1714387 RepID=A0A9W7AJ39_9STRA|nr:hypothetical protein TrLO_g15208 [Triparma laevis f. longispina]